MAEQYNELLERVASIEKAIVGPGGATIREAFAYQPNNPTRYEVPFFVNEVEGGPVDFVATRGRQEVKSTIHAYLCLFDRASGNLLEQSKSCYTWRQYVLRAFAQKIRLGNDLDYILTVLLTKWDLVDYDYGSTTFLSLQFDLSVTEMFILTVAA